jgi:hypothetical protein
LITSRRHLKKSGKRKKGPPTAAGPGEGTKDGAIRVSYDVSGTDWQLAVSDNGYGKPDGVFAQPKPDLVPAFSKCWQSRAQGTWSICQR